MFARQLAFNVMIKQLAWNREAGKGFEPMTSERWPTELRLAKDKRSLRVTFDDGTTCDLPAEYLRVTSPSAEVQGHSPAERKTVPGKRNVAITSVTQLGSPSCTGETFTLTNGASSPSSRHHRAA